MKKKLIMVTLMLALTISAVGCSKTNNKAEENTNVTSEVAKDSSENEKDSSEIKSDSSESESKNEASTGDVLNYENSGFQISLEGPWKEYDKKIQKFSSEPDSDGTTFSLLTMLVTDEALKNSEGVEDQQKKDEILYNNAKELYVIAAFKKDSMTQSEVEEFIGGPAKEVTLEVIKENDNYTYYFGTFPYDDAGLSDKEKATYKELYDDCSNVKSKIQISEPVIPTKN